jgi:hypothetical protein
MPSVSDKGKISGIIGNVLAGHVIAECGQIFLS